MTFYNLLMVSLSEILGDFQLEKYANTNDLTAFGLGITGYIFVLRH